MREALRDLAHNGWVLGIAAAIAIGYAVVAFLLALADVVLHAVAGNGPTGPFAARIAGVDVGYGRLAITGATLVLVVATGSLLLRRAGPAPTDEEER